MTDRLGQLPYRFDPRSNVNYDKVTKMSHEQERQAAERAEGLAGSKGFFRRLADRLRRR